MSTENKGLLSGVGDAMSGAFDSVFGAIDKIESPGLRTSVKVALGVAMIAIGVFVYYTMIQGIGPGSHFLHPDLQLFLKPTLMNLMGMGVLGLSGLGLWFSIKTLVGKEHQRTAAKVAALIMPFGLIAAPVLIAGACFMGGFTGGAISVYLLAGLIIVPTSMFALDHAIDVCRRKKNIITNVNDLPPALRQATRKPGFYRRAPRRQTKPNPKHIIS